MPRPGRPRISTGIHESKTLALYNAGRTLLAEQDYEAFSIAQVAKQAGCSVGAFYVRFTDKNAFLSFVIAETFYFEAHSFAGALANGDIKAIGTSAKAKQVVALLVDQFADAEFVGVMRAAIKLGFLEPSYRVPLDQYREALTDHLVDWFGTSYSKQESQIRAALQIVFGAMTDSALSEEGRKSLKSGTVQNALVYLIEGAIAGGIKSAGKTEGKELFKTSPKNPLPVSALKNSGENPSLNSAAKPKHLKRPKPISPSRIRKI